MLSNWGMFWYKVWELNQTFLSINSFVFDLKFKSNERAMKVWFEPKCEQNDKKSIILTADKWKTDRSVDVVVAVERRCCSERPVTSMVWSSYLCFTTVRNSIPSLWSKANVFLFSFHSFVSFYHYFV